MASSNSKLSYIPYYFHLIPAFFQPQDISQIEDVVILLVLFCGITKKYISNCLEPMPSPIRERCEVEGNGKVERLEVPGISNLVSVVYLSLD